LFDTGCNQSMIPLNRLPHNAVVDIKVDVYVVNGNKLDIVGYALLFFVMQGMAMDARFLVSRDIHEIILGCDWLTAQKAQWNFLERKLTIRGVNIPLKAQKGGAVEVPARSGTPRSATAQFLDAVTVPLRPNRPNSPEEASAAGYPGEGWTFVQGEGVYGTPPAREGALVPARLPCGGRAVRAAQVGWMPSPQLSRRGRRGAGAGADRFMSRESGPRGGRF
jgi:hypothetical protein